MELTLEISENVSKLDAVLSSDKIFYGDFNKSREQLNKFMYDAVSWHMQNNKY